MSKKKTPAIDSHKRFLKDQFPDHVGRFDNLCASNQEGARAEATLGLVLRSICNRLEILETKDHGGPDFLCINDDSKFIVEVTALKTESADQASGFSGQNPVGSFSLITEKLRTKVANKAGQVAGFSSPRLVAIYSEHVLGMTLLGPDNAKFLITGESLLKVPINNNDSNIKQVTRLRESVFFRPRNGEIESCRESVSGVLLAYGSSGKCHIVGALHPSPKIHFDIDLLPNIPFCKLKDWPIQRGELETEWVVGRPKSTTFNMELLAQVY